MHGHTALATLLGLSLPLQACAYHQLRVPEPNGYGDFHTVHSNAFFWGAVEETKVADKCATNVIDEVRTVTSLPQALATVLTLGIWMPATVKYKCAKRPIMPDEDEGGGVGQPSGEAGDGERSQDHHLQ